MGVTKPKTQHKKKVSITIDKQIWAAIKDRAIEARQSRSDFINNLLKAIVYRDKTYIKYKLKEAKLSQAYWEYELSITQEAEKERQERLGI